MNVAAMVKLGNIIAHTNRKDILDHSVIKNILYFIKNVN